VRLILAYFPKCCYTKAQHVFYLSKLVWLIHIEFEGVLDVCFPIYPHCIRGLVHIDPHVPHIEYKFYS
jgi:hypothetical protein